MMPIDRIAKMTSIAIFSLYQADLPPEAFGTPIMEALISAAWMQYSAPFFLIFLAYLVVLAPYSGLCIVLPLALDPPSNRTPAGPWALRYFSPVIAGFLMLIPAGIHIIGTAWQIIQVGIAQRRRERGDGVSGF